MSDDVRKTLYHAFYAYFEGSRAPPDNGRSEALRLLDSIFEDVVDSMTADVRESFLKSLQSGSSAVEMLESLLLDNTSALVAKNLEGLPSPPVKRSQLEDEVIRFLYQLPRVPLRDLPFSSRAAGGELEVDRTTAAQDEQECATESAKQCSVRHEVKREEKAEAIAGANAGVNVAMKEETGDGDVFQRRQLAKHTRRTRQYSDPVPSEHCHICCRPVRKLRFAVCTNIDRSLCRKVTCIKCFESFQWDWAGAIATDSTWTCTHCRNVCPRRAQCFVYERINSRRKRRGKETADASSKEET